MDEEVVAASDNDDQPAGEKKRLGWFLRLCLGVAGGALVVAFFLPWFELAGIANLSAFELALGDQILIREVVTGHQRWALALVPVLGLAIAATGLAGLPVSSILALISGLMILVYGFCTVVYLVFQTTGVGVWMTAGGALMALVVGVAHGMWRRRGGDGGTAHEPAESDLVET